MNVYDFGGIKLHAYKTNDFIDDEVFIVEKNGKAVVIMSCITVSIRGEVKELGNALLLRLFEKNPYMSEIYPTAESQKALTVFKLYEGSGEWFDLSKKPIERASFTFGGTKIKRDGYFITNACVGCRACEANCPQNCIDFAVTPAVIRQENCLHCGNCMEICPKNAVIREM